MVQVTIGIPSWQIRRLFDLGQEANITTWFSSSLYLIGAYLACLCLLQFKSPDKRIVNWRIFTLTLLALSCDETARIHEHVGIVLNKYLFGSIKMATAWVVIIGPVIAFFLIMVAFMMRNSLKEFPRAGKLILGGFLTIIFGAFILEGTINYLNHETLQWLWNTEIIFEETLEMLGAVLIIYGISEYYNFLETGTAKVE